jgi:transposase
MLTTMTEDEWTIVLQVFGASRSRRGDKGWDDRKFLEALHYFVVHNITWRALPAQFGHWNSVCVSKFGRTTSLNFASGNSRMCVNVFIGPRPTIFPG